MTDQAQSHSARESGDAGSGTASKTARRRRNKLRLLLILFMLLVSELLSFLAILLTPYWLGSEIVRTARFYESQSAKIEALQSDRAESIAVFDQRLGWKLKPGSANKKSHVNSQGLRGSREYSRGAFPAVDRT